MSAERLREASALMRGRAEAVRATAAEPDQWFGVEELVEEFTWGAQHEMGDPRSDADHIASWHPAVALAVADWLEQTARLHDSGSSGPLDLPAALGVADAYLGGAS